MESSTIPSSAIPMKTISEPTKRRLFQFSLSDLLLAVTLVGIGNLFFFSIYLGAFQDEELELQGIIMVTIVTLVTAFVALVAANYKAIRSWHRPVKVCLAVAVMWPSIYPTVRTLHQRKISYNETAAMRHCIEFCEAEEIYHRTDYDRDGILEYVPTLHELYETKPGAADVKLIENKLMCAEYASPQVKPYDGYLFKVLCAQSANAKGGKKSYYDPTNHKMTLGYGLIAYPANYNVTGTHVFIINNNGTIFEFDYGASTQKISEGMIEFNPFDPPYNTWISNCG